MHDNTDLYEGLRLQPAHPHRAAGRSVGLHRPSLRTVRSARRERPARVTYRSHVTVLVLCSACSGASANHAIKNEIAWDDCEHRLRS